jgi:HSP20 family protein
MANLVRWEDPFAGLTSLHSHIDDIFNDFFNTSSSRLPSLANMPATDVYTEDDKQLVTEVQAPGFSPNDINVSVNQGILEIKGEKHEKAEKDNDKKRSYMMRESAASFYRRIVLPKHADSDNVEAHFDNGTLKVIVPFKELPEPKRIQIKAINRTK